MNRRTFLILTGAALGTVPFAGCRQPSAETTPDALPGRSGAPGMALPMGLGVQLYTLRTLLEDDFEGTMGEVAAIGYPEVEFAGYYGRSPQEVRGLLDGLGLTAPSVHVPLQAIRDDLEGAIDAAQVIGHRYLVLPWLAPEDRATLDQYRALGDVLNEAGARAQEAGLQLAYHNHDFEFVAIDGEVPYDLLLDRTEPSLVQMELDLYWTAKAGADPFAYFEREPGRFPLLHLKDMKGDEAGTMTSVGDGVVPFHDIFAQAEAAGFAHGFVEHDNPADPLASIRASYAYLTREG